MRSSRADTFVTLRGVFPAYPVYFSAFRVDLRSLAERDAAENFLQGKQADP